MSQQFEITLKNRYTNKLEQEKVYGQAAVEFAYDSILGKLCAPMIASKSVSKFYGSLMDRKSSAKKIPDFIRNFDIEMDNYQAGSCANSNGIENSYISFNEFFIRKFVDGKRKFILEENKLAACAEARYFGYEKITDELKVPVKGNMLQAKDLLGENEYTKCFEGGPLVIARLCPVDYHRYHYSDDGKTLTSYQVTGDLHSVNPLALKYREDIFIKNERRIAIVETQSFGKIAYIEVGATCVGKIIQSFDESVPHKRGDEKGYFLFGGSTVIICGENGKWKPSLDIIENTKLGIETYIHLGDEMGLS